MQYLERKYIREETYEMKPVLFELKNALCSKRFLITIVGMMFLSLCSLINEMKSFPDASVYYFYMVYFYYPMWMIAFVLAPIPGATSFCIDWNTRVYRMKVIRCGKKNYILSKIIITWVTAFLTVAFSQILMLVLLASCKPLFLDGDGSVLQGGIYQAYLNTSGIGIYFISKVFFQSVGVAFLAVVALWISTKITDTLVVVTAPIIGYYLIDNITIWLKLPGYLSIPRLIKGKIEIVKGIGYTWLYVGGIFGGLTFLFSWLFFKNCKRRLENG